MAAWLTVLKLVPWGDVIEATPQILQAAKKLMGKTRAGSSAPEVSAASLANADGAASSTPVEAKIQELATRVTLLEQEQRDGAALIQSLAEQNAVVVRAVEALALRTQRLTIAVAALGAACAVLVVWVLRQA